jgi:hypothetical protein
VNKPPVKPWYTILRARGLPAARAFLLAARLRRFTDSPHWPPDLVTRVIAEAQQLTPVEVECQTAALKP